MHQARRPFRRLLVAVLVVAMVAACGDGGASTSAPVTGDGVAAPVVQVLASLDGLETVGGGEVDLVTLGAGPVVLWFWAPWCPNCRAMGPGLAALAAGHAPELTVVGVAGRGEVDDMQEFVASTGTADITHAVDADGSIWAEFGVISQPALAFVDASGAVEVVSGRQTQEAMERRIAQLLGS
jgi:thiol-disulfide isomerase/thioredoxin